ncbi:MAG: ABC transporter ATP-binding protein [Ardenticatenaceae bacterium]|nr:ABC transporter ATP-binding protein [Ardenticatenaceae bacterium]MCB9444097.1 ABC transporter ATP-binding protein [Ardenticatenaceae bacterium]
MTTQAIAAENLTYRYGELTAVDHISFQVAPGEVLGFLGPNGAGKSTTIKMLTGQLRPQEGKATLLNQDITKHAKQIQAHIGVCFEITNLYEQMSAIENLALFARLFGVKRFQAEPLLARVGLDGRGQDRVETYSKGMKQRLMIARALINQPQILFLDEPTEGLDPTSASAIRRIIREEQARGATVFLTTHDMMEADKLSDRVAFINQGKIVALDTPHALKQQFGKRILRAEIQAANGDLEVREVILDKPETPQTIETLFSQEKVVTIHSEEATLEDIFIEITGRELV